MLYKDETGYIEGYLRQDGYWWITMFVIHKDLRGKGLARNLARHLPEKAKLLACPLCNMEGTTLSSMDLIRFYESLGFRKCSDNFGNPIMERG